MKTGTKSVLFGVHCFMLHPVFVAIAWIKLYGFPWDPRIWIAFLVHDLGYIGKPNMDGKEGETHVEMGANIMHLFDGWDYEDITYSNDDLMLTRRAVDIRKQEGWIIIDTIELETSCNILFKKRKYKWHDFVLYHSRYYARAHFKPYSKLCVADKLAFEITPRWLYIPMATASGEIREYIQRAMGHLSESFYDSYVKFHPGIKRSWLMLAKIQTNNWIREHKAGEPDLTTPVNRYFENNNYNPSSNQRYIILCDHCKDGGEHTVTKLININETSPCTNFFSKN